MGTTRAHKADSREAKHPRMCSAHRSGSIRRRVSLRVQSDCGMNQCERLTTNHGTNSVNIISRFPGFRVQSAAIVAGICCSLACLPRLCLVPRHSRGRLPIAASLAVARWWKSVYSRCLFRYGSLCSLSTRQKLRQLLVESHQRQSRARQVYRVLLQKRI